MTFHLLPWLLAFIYLSNNAPLMSRFGVTHSTIWMKYSKYSSCVLCPWFQIIIKDLTIVLTSPHIKSYVLQTLLGLEYLHTHWILHRVGETLQRLFLNGISWNNTYPRQNKRGHKKRLISHGRSNFLQCCACQNWKSKKQQNLTPQFHMLQTRGLYVITCNPPSSLHINQVTATLCPSIRKTASVV